MPFPYKIHSQAYKENIETYQWYELQQPGLGLRYLNAVEQAIEHIINNPDHYGILRGKYRRIKVKGFPFTIVYEFSQNSNSIHIAAIFHNRRNPRKKFRKEE